MEIPDGGLPKPRSFAAEPENVARVISDVDRCAVEQDGVLPSLLDRYR
jgi:hypothetical protein